MSDALRSVQDLADSLVARGMSTTVARSMASRVWSTTTSLLISDLSATEAKKRADARKSEREANAIAAVLRTVSDAKASAA